MVRKGDKMLQMRDADGLDTIGGRMRAARRAKGLKVTEAAAQIELSRTSLTQWEADGVSKRDEKKLAAFVKLVDVNLDWLVNRKGPDPDLTPPADRRRKARANAEVIARRAMNGSGDELMDAPIPEIAPSLTAHASHIDLTPRALWIIPHQVIEIGFNSEPETTVIKRIVTHSQVECGLERGDYVMIDTSRKQIGEAGIYMVADPEGKSARKVVIVKKDGCFEIAGVADDLQRNGPQESVDKLLPLGRVMGIFKPA